MKLTCILLSLTLSITVVAQRPFSLSKMVNQQQINTVGGYGELSANSNAITNEFLYSFLNGGHLTEAIKNTSSNRLSNDNRFGGEINFGLYFSHSFSKQSNPDSLNPSNSNNLSLFIHAADRQYFNGTFPSDAFTLAFYGNKLFAGKTAYLSGFNFNYVRYKQYQIGLTKTNGTNISYGFGIGLLTGERYLHLNTGKTELYTQLDGEVLDLTANIEFRESDNTNVGFGAANGYGMSVGGFFQFKYNTRNKVNEGTITAEVNDFGFINWNNKTTLAKKDTTIHWEGIYINNILQITDSLLELPNPDSLLALNTITKEQTTILPTLISFTLEQRLSKHTITLGAITRYNAYFNTYVYLKERFAFTKWLYGGAIVGFGGYGNINFGVELGLNFNQFELLLATNHLEGLVFPHLSAGTSAYATIRTKF